MADDDNVGILKEVLPSGRLGRETFAIKKGERLSDAQKVRADISEEQLRAVERGERTVFGRRRGGRQTREEVESDIQTVEATQRVQRLREEREREARKLREPTTTVVSRAEQTGFEPQRKVVVDERVISRPLPKPSVRQSDIERDDVYKFEQLQQRGEFFGAKELAGVGLFATGFFEGGAGVVRTTARDPFSLVEGTAQVIVKPRETLEEVGFRASTGPRGLGTVTGEVVTSSYIGAKTPKLVGKGITQARTASFERRISIPAEQLGPDFKFLSEAPFSPGQAQLFPETFNPAKAIGDIRTTGLGGDRGVSRQTKIRTPDLELVRLESGAFELRSVPDPIGTRINLERARLLKAQRGQKPSEQLTLPKGTISASDFDVTVVVPGQRASVKVGRGGLISGRKGQVSTGKLIKEKLFRQEQINLRRPKSFLVEPTIPKLRGSSKLTQNIRGITTPKLIDNVNFGFISRSRSRGRQRDITDIIPKLTQNQIITPEQTSTSWLLLRTPKTPVTPKNPTTDFFKYTTPTPSKLPPFKINLDRVGGRTSKRSGGIASQLKGFVPSVTASVFGITGKRSKLGELTGLGIRPIIK